MSGTIDALYVDYNSKVKKGDLLLTIEPSVLQASVDEAKASLISAEISATMPKVNICVTKTLYNDGYIARAEMEQSQTAYEQASSRWRAPARSMNARKQIWVMRDYIARRWHCYIAQVDKVRQFAASFQTPDLFEIAEDLSKMQMKHPYLRRTSVL